MLGKLLKYELKAKKGVFLGTYIMALLAILLSFGVNVIIDVAGKNVFLTTLDGIFTMFSVLLIIAMFAIIMVMSVVRYYENLVKDEGYLMHTLPVKPYYLHLVKIISPVIWLLGALVIAVIALFAVTYNPKAVFDALKFVVEQLGIEFIIYMAWALLFGFACSLSMFYACINLGSLSNSNKGLMSFVAYIVIYMINQVVSSIGLVIALLIVFAGSGNMWEALNSDVIPDNYFSVVFTTSFIISLILTVGYELISAYILKNKVNLE